MTFCPCSDSATPPKFPILMLDCEPPNTCCTSTCRRGNEFEMCRNPSPPMPQFAPLSTRHSIKYMSCPYVGCISSACGDVPIIVWRGVAPLFHAPPWRCNAPSVLALLGERAIDDPLSRPISPSSMAGESLEVSSRTRALSSPTVAMSGRDGRSRGW